MKLDLAFPNLTALVTRMGAERSTWTAAMRLQGREPWQDKLAGSGIEIQVEEVQPVAGGLLGYRGENVVLYIKDTRQDPFILLNDPENARRFHVWDCAVLKEMRAKGRGERFVVTQRTDGLFTVTGKDPMTGTMTPEMDAPLRVCKVCLREMNFEGYAEKKHGGKKAIWDSFDLSDFFRSHATFFRSKPERSDKDPSTGGYVENWSAISNKMRQTRNWTCEGCGVRLSDHKRLLHCHHINGVYSDNRPSNLQVLCVVCHADQPLHGHMRVTAAERATIEGLRAAQGIAF